MELGYVMKLLSVTRPLLVLASAATLLFVAACGQSDNKTTETAAPVAAVLQDSPAAAAPMTSGVVGMRVDDFQLSDQKGTAHELYDYRNAPAIVLMTQGNGCPIVRNAVPALRKVRDAYADKGVKFFLMNSNLQDNAESIAAEVAEFGFDMPVLVDQYQLVGESLNVTRTAEIFVIDTSDMTVAYHGPVDDRLNYQTQRATAQHEYLADALDAVIAGESVSVSNVDAPGCLINFPARS
jgi:peroxiredoxin